MRRLGLAAEPEDQRAFFFPALGAALADVGPRVLISGSVDEAMAAMVVEAGAAGSCAPDINVVDRCMTPLIVNQAFARSIRAQLFTARSNILTFRAPDKFDVIATHSFFGSIALTDRPRLAAKWFELLRPGGRVITVTRLRPQGKARSFTGDAPKHLVAEVRRRATQFADEIRIPSDDLAEAVLRYARERASSFAVPALGEVVDLLEAHGFRMLHAATCQIPGRITGIEGPGLPRAGLYAEVIAER